jgi:hypothetical protein
MTLDVFLFLLLSFLMLCLVRLWHFFLHHAPPRSRGGAVHTPLPRLRYRHAPHAIAPLVASPAPSRRLSGLPLPLRLYVPGVR